MRMLFESKNREFVKRIILIKDDVVLNVFEKKKIKTHGATQRINPFCGGHICVFTYYITSNTIKCKYNDRISDLLKNL